VRRNITIFCTHASTSPRERWFRYALFVMNKNLQRRILTNNNFSPKLQTYLILNNESFLCNKRKKRDMMESIFPWTGQHNENDGFSKIIHPFQLLANAKVQSNFIDYILILFHLFIRESETSSINQRCSSRRGSSKSFKQSPW
jgi:hypothetical protein